MEEKNKSYFHNWITVFGQISSVVLFAVLVFLIGLDFLSQQNNPYLGVITYLIIPAFFSAGLLLIPLGAWLERSRRSQRGYTSQFPRIDFNNPTHQRWAFTTIAVTTLFLLFSFFGLYRAYDFSESVTFCGRLCHVVMEPEYTAYQESPHARVACVKCHIGPGATWFVRSKLTGLYQIYAVLANCYSKPIETPVKNLRPAQETCEQCHWPKHFFGAVEQNHKYYLSDEKNTEWDTRMLMFVGGGTPRYGKKEGIHWWHSGINNKIYYIASDRQRQKIPWVRIVEPNGKENVYADKDSGFSAQKPPPGEMRSMDCIDCHNRPSHIYNPPAKVVNEAITTGGIVQSLPYVKREAVKALLGDYPSLEVARVKIREHLEKFYRGQYPAIWANQRKDVLRTIAAVTDIYRKNFFPKMNVSWKVYPNNIGHLVFPGCFRCHDGKHQTREGKVITNQCSVCHNILEQGKPGAMESAVNGLEFKHPDESTADAWKEMSCYDCHTGGSD